jgi:hypothetical protein
MAIMVNICLFFESFKYIYKQLRMNVDSEKQKNTFFCDELEANADFQADFQAMQVGATMIYCCQVRRVGSKKKTYYK